MARERWNSGVEQVIACDLSAIADVDAHERTSRSLFGRVEQVTELEDGFGYRLPGDPEVLDEVVAFVGNERLCCPFLTFEIVLEPDQGPVWLRLRGSEEIKTFLDQELNTRISE